MPDKSKKKKTARPERESLTKIWARALEILTWPWAWLPMDWGLALGAAGGRLAYRLMTSRRRIALANIEMIKANGSLPAATNAETLAREVFANLGRSGWEIVRYYHRGLTPFLPDCHIEEGREYLLETLEECRREGRSLVFVTGHMGNWEVMCHYLAHYGGFIFNIVGRDTNQPVTDLLVRRLRTRTGDNYISKKGGAREMVAVLKHGGVLGTLIDQAVIGNHVGEMIPFMGREATTNLGPMRLAHHSKSKIMLVCFRREGRRQFMKIFPPLTPRRDIETEEAIIDGARQLNEWLGQYIREHPEQWMWGHRRWKTREGVRRDKTSIT